jgi:3-dehydroquinate dehydratase I
MKQGVRLKNLKLGGLPRVVGVISSPDFPKPKNLPCDLVEIRLDSLPEHFDWLQMGREIERAGRPVILTARLKIEGGNWKKPDAARRQVFSRALENFSAVDVELQSEIAAEVCAEAKRLKKAAIVSHHDFLKTPSLGELKQIAARAGKLGTVAKIATMIHSDADVKVLETLLAEKIAAPLCVIGMGAWASQTRVSFALHGSCLTYGFLDGQPSAPGQLSAAELATQLRAASPEYNADFLVRKQGAMGA